MLRDRGYTVSDQSHNQTLDEFKIDHTGKSREALNMLFQKPSESENTTDLIESKILVFYPSDDKVSSQVIKSIATKMCELNVLTSIVVMKGTTNIARKELENLHPCRIELFEQDELMVNITKHDLVPAHTVLSPENKAELLKKYRVKESQLPKIGIEDPIARYFGVKRGQVMKIVRPSETAGRYVTYRLAY